MAIASFLKPQDIIDLNLRVSTADVAEVQYYSPAGYRRMEQVFKGDQDSQLQNVMLPKATIEILLMLEEAWWPTYITKAARTTLWSVGANGQLITGFKPENLVKTNQWMIELETYLVVAKFYETLVNDNANINEKDKFNWEIARERFQSRWNDCMQASHFYDVNSDGMISKIEENNDMDINYYSEDRRYF
jgi:hypothetical protein